MQMHGRGLTSDDLRRGGSDDVDVTVVIFMRAGCWLFCWKGLRSRIQTATRFLFLMEFRREVTLLFILTTDAVYPSIDFDEKESN